MCSDYICNLSHVSLPLWPVMAHILTYTHKNYTAHKFQSYKFLLLLTSSYVYPPSVLILSFNHPLVILLQCNHPFIKLLLLIAWKAKYNRQTISFSHFLISIIFSLSPYSSAAITIWLTNVSRPDTVSVYNEESITDLNG